MKEFLDSFSLSRGHILDDGMRVILFESKELARAGVDHTLVMILQKTGVFEIFDQEINECIVSSKKFSGGDIYMLGYWGGVYILKESGLNKGLFDIETLAEPKADVPLRDFFVHAEELYAVGMGDSIYRLINEAFVPMSGKEPSYDELNSGYQSGWSSQDEAVAVGMNGIISCMSNGLWVDKNSPTNISLNSVVRASNGDWIAAGMNGVVVLMRGDEIDIVENEVTNEDFWSLCEFGNKIYLATTRYIYEMDMFDLSIEPTNFTCGVPNSCFYLSSSEKELLSVGEADALVFDGKCWVKII